MTKDFNMEGIDNFISIGEFKGNFDGQTKVDLNKTTENLLKDKTTKIYIRNSY